MREKKFTAGGWRILDLRNVGEGRITIARRGDPPVIARIQNIASRRPLTDEDMANAALIAAAPELLEALELMVARLEERSEYDKCGQLYYGARAAIAKAYGESP